MAKVKNMPRHQQKAVFARMKDKDNNYRLEGAEGFQKRRHYLMENRTAQEEYENAKFDIWQSKKLTANQKMGKIARLEKEHQKKIEAAKIQGGSYSISGDVVEEKYTPLKDEEKKKLMEEFEAEENGR